MRTGHPLSPERRRELIDKETSLVVMSAIAVLCGICGGIAFMARFRLSPWSLVGVILITSGFVFARRACYQLSAIEKEFERHGGSLEERAYYDDDGPGLF